MRWITLLYLYLSVALVFLILYAMINTMVTYGYGYDNAQFYFDAFLECMVGFLIYVLLNIVYIVAIIVAYYKKKYS